MATSTWYFDFDDHRSPHDAWLESIEISEAADSPHAQRRCVSIRLRLLGAYHDGRIEFVYRDVCRHRLEFEPQVDAAPWGHRDWRYDEFRLSTQGCVEHEIEWWRSSATGSWLINGEDDQFSVDGVSYARCIVVANGRALCTQVLRNPAMFPKDMEFETLLAIAPAAYERVTGQEFDHLTPISYETYSNRAGWA